MLQRLMNRIRPVTQRISAMARGDAGQTTAEYALVILGAAAVAGLLIAWAANSHAVGKLFDVIIGKVTGSVS